MHAIYQSNLVFYSDGSDFLARLPLNSGALYITKTIQLRRKNLCAELKLYEKNKTTENRSIFIATHLYNVQHHHPNS